MNSSDSCCNVFLGSVGEQVAIAMLSESASSTGTVLIERLRSPPLGELLRGVFVMWFGHVNSTTSVLPNLIPFFTDTLLSTFSTVGSISPRLSAQGSLVVATA